MRPCAEEPPVKKMKMLKVGDDDSDVPKLLRPIFKRLEDRQKRLVNSIQEIFKSTEGGELVEGILKLEIPDENKRVLIATIGESGAGKSSLINALLRSDIAPTSLASSCTTVPTEFCYRKPGGSEFRAEIEFETRGEAIENARALCEYILLRNEEVQKSHNNEKSDIVLEESDIAESKLKALIPDFQAEDLDLHSTLKKIELLYDKNKTLALSKQIISTDDEEEFAEQVQDLLKNNNSFENSPTSVQVAQLWPLVKRVRLYLDSPLLQNGVTLVDLPGSNDENAARSAMAKSYLPEVDEVILAAAYTRILSNSTLESMANLGLQTQIEYEGCKRLIIACTKIDMLKDMDERQLRSELCTLLPSFKEQMNKLKKEKTEAKTNKQKNKVAKVDDEIQALTNTARDNQIPGVIEQRFKQMLKSQNISFKLFMVCSKAYQKEKDHNSKAAQKTQIPALVDFLSHIAIEKRAIDGKEFLEKFQKEIYILQTLLEAWEARASQESHEKLKNTLESAMEDLQKKLDSTYGTALAYLQKIGEDFLGELNEVVEGAGVRAVEQHQKFMVAPKNITYNRYKSICIKKGEEYKPKGKDEKFHLNKALTSFLIKDVKTSWEPIKSADKIVQDYEVDIRKCLGSFRDIVLKCLGDTEIDTKPIEKLLNSKYTIASRCIRDFTRRRKKVLDALSNTKELRTALKSSYTKAIAIDGIGAQAKMKDLIDKELKKTDVFEGMEANAKLQLEKMIGNCADAMQKHLDDLIDGIKKAMSGWYDDNRSSQANAGQEQRKAVKEILAKASKECDKDAKELDKLIKGLGTF